MTVGCSIFFLLVLIFVLDRSETAQLRGEYEKEILKEFYLKNKFHNYLRPYGDSTSDDPVYIYTSLYVLNIDVDVQNQEFEVTMYFRQNWNDTRLAYDNHDVINYLVLHDTLAFWTPDLFFVNEKSSYFHGVTKSNNFVRIFPNGEVLFSQRITVRSACSMDLRKYPLDRQTCELRIETYGYTTDDILLQWMADDPVQGASSTLGYDVSYSYTSRSIVVGDSEYSANEVQIHLDRYVSEHFLHIYAPLSLLICISWVTFWLSPTSTTVRLSLCALTTTAALIQINTNQNYFVSPGYPTAMDQWVSICCCLLFAAFFENLLVIYRRQHVEDEQESKATERSRPLVSLLSNIATGRRSLDFYSKIVFPAVFILSHLAFIFYIHGSESM